MLSRRAMTGQCVHFVHFRREGLKMKAAVADSRLSWSCTEATNGASTVTTLGDETTEALFIERLSWGPDHATPPRGRIQHHLGCLHLPGNGKKERKAAVHASMKYFKVIQSAAVIDQVKLSHSGQRNLVRTKRPGPLKCTPALSYGTRKIGPSLTHIDRRADLWGRRW